MICLKQRGQMVDKTGTVDTAMIIQLVVKGSLTIKRKETDISLTLLSIDNSIKIRKTKMKIDFQTAPNRSLLKVKKIKKKISFPRTLFSFTLLSLSNFSVHSFSFTLSLPYKRLFIQFYCHL